MKHRTFKEPAKLTKSTGESSFVILRLKEVDKKSRLKNAIKVLGIFWLLSIFSLFLPLAHFLLVPAFFLLGIFLSYKKYEKNILLLPSSLSCLSCTKTLSSKERLEKLPISIEITCPHCLVVNFLNSD